MKQRSEIRDEKKPSDTGRNRRTVRQRSDLPPKWQAALAAMDDREKRGVELELEKAMRARTRGKAIVDFGGVIGSEAGPGHVATEAETSPRTRAALNAARLEWILRNEHEPERVNRATRAIEGAVRAFLLPQERGVRADTYEVVVLLEFIQFRHHRVSAADAAHFLHEHCAFDVDGLGKIPKSAWRAALKQWRGRWRSKEGTRGGRPKRGDYDWRSIVLALLEHVRPGSRTSRRDAMRRLNDLIDAEAPTTRKRRGEKRRQKPRK